MKPAPNFAEDEEFATNFANVLLKKWRTLQSERAERETRWQDAYDVWSVGNQDINFTRNYNGRANLNLPQLRKEVETMSRRLVKAMFPEDYLDAEGSRFESEELIETNVMVLRWFLETKMQLRTKLMPWVKQGVLFGTSPIRSYWHKEVNEMIYKKRFFKEGPRGELIPDFKRIKENVTIYNAPKVRAESMFQTWVYPYNASDPSEIEEVYFRTKLTWEDLQKKKDLDVYTKISDLEDYGREKDQSFDQEQIKMQAFGESGTFLASSNAGKLYDVLEVWGRAEMPNGKVLPYVCEIINENPSFCRRIQQNPLWHQSIPIDFMRFILPPAGEFYGRGLPEATIPLQHQLNDILNQSMDGTTLALNSITIVNPAYAPNSESFEIEPNAVWWADPNAVKQMTFPDLSDVGIKNAGQLRSIITEISDNSPQLPDPIAGKARSTGQAQLAINEWQTDLYSFVNQLIVEALQPFAYKTHALIQQNIEDDDVIRITGKYAGKWINRVVTPADIVGNFDWKWMGAIQVENHAVKVQQMINFFKIFPTIPPEAKIKINWQEFIYMIMREGWQIRQPERVIDSERTNTSVPPYLEDKIMIMGGDVQVSVRDDDKLHITDHTLTQAQQKDPYIRYIFEAHILNHKKALAEKEQQMIQAQQMMQQQQMMMQQQQIEKQVGHPGRPQKNPMQHAPNLMGNQAQVPDASNPGDVERQVRTT